MTYIGAHENGLTAHGRSALLPAALLDPFADKVMIFCLAGSLAYSGLVPAWFVAVVSYEGAVLSFSSPHSRVYGESL
jgi:hypothetical protein